MTIEITDQMVYAFAGEPEITATDAHAIRVGLTAVMAIVDQEQVEPLRAVLEKLLDPEPCAQFDHHGDCQEHGTGSERPCPHARAKDLLGWSAP